MHETPHTHSNFHRSAAGPVGGVAEGLAQHFNLDPVLVRLGFITGALVTGPAALIAYAAVWAVAPVDDGSTEQRSPEPAAVF